MVNLKILIVEDSYIFATKLELLIKSIGYFPIGIVDNSEEAIEVVKKKEPDLILMDIDIKGNLNGIEVAEKIAEYEIPILFITSHSNDILYERAKKINHSINYLVKPLDKITLKSAIESALKNLGNHLLENHEEDDFILNDCFFIKKNNLLVKVPIDSISHIESDGNYSRIFSKDETHFLVRMTLSKVSVVLPPKKFIRVHRQYLVNASHIDNIELKNNEISINKTLLPIGRSYREMLLKKLKKLS